MNDTIKAFGKEERIFLKNKDYQKSIVFTIIQIGELVRKFSNEFFAETLADIPWKDIVKTRDKYVHGYETIDFKSVWDTTIIDIPVLEAFCRETLKNIQTLKDNNAEPEPPRFRP
jgi:uncharacterized protein with HEPN domain